MLSVVLTILKFIGIAILILLGLLLLIAGLVLFVPIRYKADGFYKEYYCVRAKLTWLLHVISFSFHYEKEQPIRMKLRIFGIPIYDNLKLKKNKKDKSDMEDTLMEEDSLQEDKQALEDKNKPEIVASSISKDTVSHDVEKKQENQNEFDMKSMEKKNFVQKIKIIFGKTVGFFKNIKYTFHRLCDTIKKLVDNINYYIDLFQKDSTKAAMQTCKKQLLRIIKNIKPQKFQLNLHIGMNDPASMGDILGVWGMLYPIHEGHIDICPDFEKSVFEGDFYCKGRLSVYVYVWTLMIVLFDKNINRFKKCFVREGK